MNGRFRFYVNESLRTIWRTRTTVRTLAEKSAIGRKLLDLRARARIERPERTDSTRGLSVFRPGSIAFDGRRPGKKILFIDDRVPHIELGAGFPRSNAMLWSMVTMGYSVTFYPIADPYENPDDAYRDIPADVEVILGYGSSRLRQFLGEREDYYDVMVVSRPGNMAVVGNCLSKLKGWSSNVRLIYDSEALVAPRYIQQLRLRGEDPPPSFTRKLYAKEMKLAEGCGAILSVSEIERRKFAEHGVQTSVVGHALEANPTPNSFSARKDILFVGPIQARGSPNDDGLSWFIDDIFPIMQSFLGENVCFIVAGSNRPEQAGRFAHRSIKLLGAVGDLTSLYNQCRVFVAPIRCAAGIPLKVLEAASRGLPTVVTAVLGQHLDWNDGAELLTAPTAQAFALKCVELYRDEQLWNSIRSNALARVETECSPEVFSRRLSQAIEGTAG